MINELCPDGVEYVKLGDVCEILDNQRKPISKSKRTYGIYPYYGANGVQDYIDNYIFDGTYLLMGEDGSVINADKTPILNWAEGKIWVNNHAHVLGEKCDVALLRYLYYILQSTDVSDIVRGTPPKINRANLRNIEIPLPPLSIQQKIVSVLDSFTTLIDKMKQEVEMRKKQMEYYREKLLTFEDGECEWKTLGEVAKIGTGSGNTNEGLEEGLYPFYTRGQEVLRKNTFEYDEEAIITAGDGVGVGKVMHYVKGKYALHQRAYRFKPNEGLSTKYLYYYMQVTFYKYVCGNAVASSVSSLRKPKLQIYPIPVPSLDKQSEIVSTLDKFESYITKLEKMIVLRQKQYEYYREQLLTFE